MRHSSVRAAWVLQTIHSPPEHPEMTVIAAKQIYADHYFEAGLEVLAAVDRTTAGGVPDPGSITLVAIRRYRFDHMPSGGLLNIRGRVANGLRDNVSADLKRLERESEAEWAAKRDRRQRLRDRVRRVGRRLASRP